MNNTVYKIITRNTKGRVTESGIQNVLDKDNLVHAEQILNNTCFQIIRFDLYTNRALVNCEHQGHKFTALFDFDFLTENCILINKDKNTVVESVYLPEREDDYKLKYTRYEVGVGLSFALLIGYIIGMLMGSVVCLG